jgi:hypothetical protein
MSRLLAAAGYSRKTRLSKAVIGAKLLRWRLAYSHTEMVLECVLSWLAGDRKPEAPFPLLPTWACACACPLTAPGSV